MNKNASISSEVLCAARVRAFFSLMGGGGGGYSPRFLSVALAGLTVLTATPHAGALDECGQPENNAVLCDSSDGYDSGIKYEEDDGLTLTVRPSGTNTVTITSPIPTGSRPTALKGDVFLKGGGTLKVVLDGNVRIVNGADRAPLVDHDLSGRTIKAIHHDHVNAYRTSGVYVLHEEDKEGEIGIDIGEGARVGAPDKPSGMYGVAAYFTNGTGDISITNRGKVYGHYRGIRADHAGEGSITIKTEKGSVTSMGLWARSRTGADVTIRHHGRSEIKEPTRYKTGSTQLEGIGYYGNAAIDVTHRDTSAGTDETPSSEITVISSGDIVVDAADWAERTVYGIEVNSQGDSDSVVPITVDVTGGTITADSVGFSDGIRIISQHRGGLVKVDLAGTVARTGPNGSGIYIQKDSAGTDIPGIKASDIRVTLRPGARIGVDGERDRFPVGKHGVLADYAAEDGSIKVSVEKGARIGTERTSVGGDGIWSRIVNLSHEGDITVTNHGFIHAKGSGVYSWHQGWGAVVVKHEAGKIIAGDKAGEFGQRTTSGAELVAVKDRTAGILAVHGGAGVFLNKDNTFKNAGIGKIEIISKADIESKGEGILAYVKDLNDNAGFTTVVPITVGVTGGTIVAKGAGVHAEVATDYTNLESAQVLAGQTEAGAIAVTVDESAAVMAEEDGVYVKGGGTQTVIIHGKVTGGGGEHAGVKMRGGGTLTIGARAEIGAESGRAVKSEDGKLTITMEKDMRGRIAWIQDKFVNTADMTTFEGVSEGETVTAVSDVKTRGVYEGGMERRVTLEKTTEDSLDTYQFKQESAREFREYHARARVYEALPSVLLDLNRQTSAHARLSARRDGNGGWARVWFGDGEREADRSTTEGGLEGRALAWDFEYWGAEMGFDVPTSTEGLLLGVSAHYRDGEADVERGGRIDASGFGFGVSATYRAEEGLYVDGQVSYTRFDDIDLSSDERGRLASGLDADGYAVGLEVGRRMEMAERNVVLTPRGGLAWSSVDVDGFEDVKVEGYAGDRRVSFGSEDSFQGRVGVLAESVDGRMYASLDVEHEFSEDRDVTASGARLDSEAEATWARLGFGGNVELDEAGEAVLSGQGFYALADGDNRDYGASVALRVRF